MLVFFLNRVELLLSSVNLTSHWSINYGQFKDLVYYLHFGGYVVNYLFTTQELPSSNNPFNCN